MHEIKVFLPSYYFKKKLGKKKTEQTKRIKKKMEEKEKNKRKT